MNWSSLKSGVHIWHFGRENTERKRETKKEREREREREGAKNIASDSEREQIRQKYIVSFVK